MNARRQLSMTHAHRSLDERFAAKLMFQFRVDGDAPGGFRTVEERIVLISALNAAAAYAVAKHKGKVAKYNYLNDDGGRVYFEFVGVLDLINLGPETEDDEVWYEIRRMKDPMQRKRDLVPDKQELDAFKLERKPGSGACVT
jgi:hypothetical protein